MDICFELAPDQTDAAEHAKLYRALAARDARFDGVFFTGVTSTGIYCRPICAARTPRASSCRFFHTAATAEAAGFRPCLRCRPELAPYALQQNLADAVWQRIVAGALNRADQQSGIEQLASAIGLSSRQLRRVVQQHFGVTPIELAQTQRLLFAKKLLQETSLPIIDIAGAAGFGSVRRFNALFTARYRMAPTALRRSADSQHGSEDALTLRLAYRPPFAWQAMLRYLAGRAMPGLELVDATAYHRTVRLQQREGWLRVSAVPNRHLLQVEVAASLAGSLMPLLARLRTLFDLDANPLIIERHLESDPLLAPILQAQSGLRVAGAFDAFELGVRAILGQQISVAAATTLSGRLVREFGAVTHSPFIGLTHHFPSAELLASLPVATIAKIGLPLNRAETLHAFARFVQAGGLQMRADVSLQQALDNLQSIRGIGAWTANYIALRALRFPDAFPAGDLALQKAATGKDSTSPAVKRLTEKQLLARATGWAPWRGYAAMLLWHSPSTFPN